MDSLETSSQNCPPNLRDETARSILAAMALRIRQSLDLESILHTTVVEVRQLLRVDRALIYRFEPDWSGTVAVESTRQEEFSILDRVVRDDCFQQQWLSPYQNRCSRIVEDTRTSELDPCYLKFLEQFQVRANLVVPITIAEQKSADAGMESEEVTTRLWGLLVAHECSRPRQWQAEEIAFLEELSTQVAIAIQQATLVKQLQAELAQRRDIEENLHRQARIFDCIHDGVILTDLDGRIIDWNPAAEKIFGYTKAEVLGQTPGLLHRPEDSATLTGKIIEGVERDGRWSGEILFVGKDGTEGICETTVVPLRDRHGRTVATIGVNRDITARKQAETELQEAQERLTLAVRGSREGLWDWNIQTNDVYYAPRFKEILGYAEGEMENKFHAFESRLHPEDRDRVLAAVRNHLEHRLPYDIEYRLRSKTGEYRWLHARGQAIWESNGRATRMSGSVNDITHRKETEAALRQSEARYSSLTNDVLDKSAVGIFILDARFRVVWINQALEQFFGLRREEVIGRDKRQLIGDRISSIFADPQAFSDRVFATYDNNTYTEHFECRVLPSEARQERWLEHFSQPIRVGLYAGGRIEHYTDITERKQAEANLREAKADLERRVAERTAELTQANLRLQRELEERRQVQGQLRSQAQFLDNVRESVIATDLEGRITYWGQGARSLYGYATEEVMDRQIPLTPPFAAAAETRVQTAISQGYWNGEYRQQRQDGSSFWVDASLALVRDDRGRPSGLIGIERDITKRKQAEATLRESERRWRSLLENIQLLVVGLSLEGRVEYVNPFFLKLTGYSEAEVVGKDWFETFLSPAKRSQGRQTFQELLNNNLHPYYQQSIITRAGEEKIIVWNNTQLQNLQKETIGTMSIGEDITERYAIERMKDEFVSVVSHELRTPLTSIHGALNLLSSGLVPAHSPRGDRVIKIAAESAERLVRLVNDILELERLESGKIHLSPQHISADRLLHRAAEQMQVVANRAGVSLQVVPQALECYADPDRALQVLTNLLSNAIKFSEAGDTVWLSVELEPNAETGQAEPTALCFKVQDQGRGIPPEKLESIFERFHQVDASDSRNKGGTGLGLAICRSIVEQHGGRIWANSTLHAGSCFYFTLPTGDKTHECKTHFSDRR